MRPLIILILSSLIGAPAASQDTVVVRSSGPGVWRNPRLVEELRIGVLDGDDRYIFGGVSYVEETADGFVWIVDSQGPRVRIYDQSGRYVRDVFRPGAGPGEIRSVMGIDRTPDGHIAIWDLPNQRVSLYRPNGDYVTAFTSNSSSWIGESFRVDTAGRHWVFTSVRNPACIRRVAGSDGTVHEVGSEGPGCQRLAYLRFSAKGERGLDVPLTQTAPRGTQQQVGDAAHADTVFIPIPRDEERVPGFVIMLPEGPAQPFVPEWDYALSPLGHLVTAHSMRYAINIVPVPGGAQDPGRVTRIEQTYEPVRLTRGERSDWQARADFYTRRNPRSASSGVQVPEVKPALRSVSVDQDGRVWVDRYVPAVKRSDIDPRPASPDRPPPLTWREPRTFDVFEPSGRFLGTIVAPPQARFVWQSGSTLWAVVRGEMDENYVVRYRLVTN